MVTGRLRGLALAALLFALAPVVGSGALAAEGDRIADIEIRNVKRISTDLVFVNLPLRIGDSFDEQQIAEAVKSLYSSGYFDDILISREGDRLVITIHERPTIRSLEIEGNKLIPSEQLIETLGRNNIAVGEVLRRDTLDQIITELEQVYGSQGRYGTVIDMQTDNAGELLINLTINIVEAPPALVADINIIGNRIFTDDVLIAGFESNERDFWTVAFSWAYDANSYARTRLAGDLERLRDFYFERGYVDFLIRSTDVTISNDYRNVYVSITVDEGKQYVVGSVEFAGELIGDLTDYTDKVDLKTGDTYLASSATQTELDVKSMLEDLGYGFAQVDLQLDTNNAARTVDLTYLVKPGKRLYIRRINFSGNTSTTENTLRRELRIFEGGWFSNAKIVESENRLKRLGFFTNVSHEIKSVPGSSDQVDIEFSLEDIPTGSFSAALTYSNLQGVGFGLNLAEKNVAGTGNAGSINVQTSERVQQVGLNWTKPYTNYDGASLSTGLNYYKVNYKGSEIANYATSSYSLEASIGYPVGDTWRFNYGGSIARRDIILGSDPIVEVSNFTDRYGETVNVPALNLSLNQNSYDSGFLPTRGLSQNISLFTTPGNDDLHFYRLGYRANYYQPLDSRRRWLYRPTMRLGYGKSYDEDRQYPFLFNYYAGGYGTVRGYAAGSLGPRATNDKGEAGTIGGNILLQSSQELVFPVWFHTERTRFSLFYDIGNVYTDHCEVPNVDWCREGVDTGELRSSYGLTIAWFTLVGPLVFIFPRAINPRDDDLTNTFEFSLGRVF